MATAKLHLFVVVFTASLALQPAHGFQVLQPHNRSVNADGTASITCEHTANVSTVEDVRLNALPVTGPATRRLLCQKGMKKCQGVVLHQDGANRCVFILLDVGPQALRVKYECEFTIAVNDLDVTEKGTPTVLLAGDRKMSTLLAADPSYSTRPTQSHLLLWIVIGLLALLLLYSCAITTAYIRQRLTNKGPETAVYVEMRKKSPPVDQGSV